MVNANATVSCYPKHFLMEALGNYYTFLLATTKFFWQVLESIPKFIIEVHAQLYLFVRGSNKRPRESGIVSIFTKGDFFHLLYLIFLHPSKKAFLSPLGGIMASFFENCDFFPQKNFSSKTTSFF